MEVWFARTCLVLSGLATASVARADPPATTVVFGTPATEPRVIEAPVRAPAAATRAPAEWPAADDPIEGSAPSEGARTARPDGADRSTPEPPAPARSESGPLDLPSPEPASPEPSASAGAGSQPAAAERACPRAVTVVRRFGARTERVRMPLLDCEGRPREEARLALSVLARSRAVEQAPGDDELRALSERGGEGDVVSEGVRLLHPGLLERLQRVGEAFDPHPIEIVSGYRPEAPSNSRHHHARALDVVVRGASREELRDLAVTFPQTGVGWYPNSTFVHLDVREESAYWVDLSGPGERPRYVRGAEPPAPSGGGEGIEALDAVRIDDALEAVRTGVRVALPGEGPDGAPSDEELARIRRETEAALRGIVVPAM